eukprot:scaffold225470_cov64-Attheya_sp.AAC.8
MVNVEGARLYHKLIMSVRGSFTHRIETELDSLVHKTKAHIIRRSHIIRSMKQRNLLSCNRKIAPPTGDLPIGALEAGVHDRQPPEQETVPLSMKSEHQPSADVAKQGKVGTKKRKSSISNNQPHSDH